MPIKVNSNFCSLPLAVYSSYAIHDVLETIKIIFYIKYGLSSVFSNAHKYLLAIRFEGSCNRNFNESNQQLTHIIYSTFIVKSSIHITINQSNQIKSVTLK